MSARFILPCHHHSWPLNSWPDPDHYQRGIVAVIIIAIVMIGVSLIARFIYYLMPSSFIDLMTRLLRNTGKGTRFLDWAVIFKWTLGRLVKTKNVQRPLRKTCINTSSISVSNAKSAWEEKLWIVVDWAIFVSPFHCNGWVSCEKKLEQFFTKMHQSINQ